MMQNIDSFVDEAAAAAGRSGIDQPLRRSETGRVGVGGFDAPANPRRARDHHGIGNCRGFAAEASESEPEAGDLEQRPRRSPCLLSPCCLVVVDPVNPRPQLPTVRAPPSLSLLFLTHGWLYWSSVLC